MLSSWVYKYGTGSSSDRVQTKQECFHHGSTNTEPGAIATGGCEARILHHGSHKYGTGSSSDRVQTKQECFHHESTNTEPGAVATGCKRSKNAFMMGPQIRNRER